MSSLDFVIQLTQTLEEQGIQHILICLQEFKDGSDKVDAFINVKSEEALVKIQKGVVEALKNKSPDNGLDKTKKKK